MLRHLTRSLLITAALFFVAASYAEAGEHDHQCRHCGQGRSARVWRGIFPYGVKTPRPADPYANPYTDVRYWYPKYYGNLHNREFHRFGYPTGDYPIRGTAW